MEDYADAGVSAAPPTPAAAPAVSIDEAVPVIHNEQPGAAITKVTILTNQSRFAQLEDALDHLGVTGLTVTNVFGYGIQKGHTTYYRGAPVEARLLPKIKIDVVVSKIPTQTLVEAAKRALYTGNVGDGKIFISDVRDVVKVRTGETGYDALQDEE